MPLETAKGAISLAPRRCLQPYNASQITICYRILAGRLIQMASVITSYKETKRPALRERCYAVAEGSHALMMLHSCSKSLEAC